MGDITCNDKTYNGCKKSLLYIKTVISTVCYKKYLSMLQVKSF